ncbi:MAG: HlyD family efflux transporter periplasmic adaptor subunit [Pseudomonadota bacterium]
MASSHSGRLSPLVIGLVVILVLSVSVSFLWTRPWEETVRSKIHQIDRVSFDQVVRERGYVAPAKVVKIRSEIPSNQAKLVWLAEEGQLYKKGNLVAQFDSKPFTDKLEVAQQVYVDAQAKLENAKQALELQQEENQARLEAVARKIEIARIKADDIRNGTGQLTRKKLELAIEQVQRQHVIAVAEKGDYDELLATGHVSQREHDKIADTVKRTSEALSIAKADLDNFNQFEMPRLLREAELVLDEADSEKARVVRTTTLELKQRETELAKRRYDLQIAGSVVEKARDDVENCDVRAPIDGVLLYLDLPRERQKQKPQLGDAIWFRQAFMAIPDTSELIVEIQVREIDVAQVSSGAAAKISLDAFPGKTYDGVLTGIGSVAESENPGSTVRRFSGRVRFSELAADVHMGMSASVEILVRTLKDVLAIPVESLHYREGRSGVFLTDGQSDNWRPVAIGEVGSEWIEVVSGIKAGDRIRVNPP